MKIVVVARCFNEIKNIDRFITSYLFADKIIISDGGSNDGSYEYLRRLASYGQVRVIKFEQQRLVNGQLWNDDNPHIQYIIDAGKAENPDWIILDDMDDVPNKTLREDARRILEETDSNQVNAFRLYMWGDDQYFPQMNNNFDPNYTSLWAWRPDKVDIHADLSQHHGTFVGFDSNALRLPIPNCLLHKSWHPDTIQAKIDRYTAVGIGMNHPLNFAGAPQPLPEWAVE